MLSLIPQLNASPVQPLNVLKHEARYVDFNWNELPLRFHFSDRSQTNVSQFGCVFQIGAHTFTVGLSNWPSLKLEGVDVLVADLNHLPILVAQGILEVALEPLCALMAKAFQQPVDLKSVFFEPLSEVVGERIEWMLLNSSNQSPWLSGCLFLEPEALVFLADTWKLVPATTHTVFNDAPYALRLDIGHQLLTPMEYSSLRVQDIIFLDETASPGDRQVHVYLGPYQAFLADYVDKKVSFKNWINFSMSDAHLNTSQVVSELPVHLHFSIGEKMLTIGELQALKSGYVFEFEPIAHDVVKIYVGHQLVGQGSLVQVQDRLGVRLTALGHDVHTGLSDQAAVVLSTDEDR